MPFLRGCGIVTGKDAKVNLMRIVVSPLEMQNIAAGKRIAGQRIGFVPTMGCLHEGHMSLVDLARKEADAVVVSIFVNPSQFGPGEDFERYPRNLERDSELCRARGVDIIFHPSADDMYLPGHSVFVDEDRLSRGFCGALRPGHFRGVLTVVAKLFNIVRPDTAVFGQKDAQQARLIQQMVADLNFPVRILLGPIVRESDGLAMSSRNAYLSATERRDALCLRRALQAARRLYRTGERGADSIVAAMKAVIEPVSSARVDYAAIVDQGTFQPIQQLQSPALAALAVRIGKTRLIDNLTLPDDTPSNLPD